MEASVFHPLADRTLAELLDRFEALDESGALEADLEQGALAVTLRNGKRYLLSKHGPTAQLWLSSPLSGGLHFGYDGQVWRLPDGRELLTLLWAELAQAGIFLEAKG